MKEETKVIYEKPIPLKNTYNAPYWDAADRHELNVQKCNTCSNYNHPLDRAAQTAEASMYSGKT